MFSDIRENILYEFFEDMGISDLIPGYDICKMADLKSPKRIHGKIIVQIEGMNGGSMPPNVT